jgi:hypothetical protein
MELHCFIVIRYVYNRYTIRGQKEKEKEKENKKEKEKQQQVLYTSLEELE